MFFRILKKDLKRKKTMNVILLLFVILATTFVSSSVNNIIAVVTGLDSYFEKAGMPDYFVATIEKNGGKSMEELLDEMEAVDSCAIYLHCTHNLEMIDKKTYKMHLKL